jgi:hypothetical protein
METLMARTAALRVLRPQRSQEERAAEPEMAE